jgi:hypothetical protein
LHCGHIRGHILAFRKYTLKYLGAKEHHDPLRSFRKKQKGEIKKMKKQIGENVNHW